MERKNYIDDGYSELGYVKANPGIHEEFRFKFRPMLVADYSALREQNDKMSAAAYDRLVASAMVKQLVSWEMMDRPIAVTSVLRLRALLFTRVYLIITGMEASDTDPLWLDDKQTEEAESGFIASLTEEAESGVARETADAKNSKPGSD
jgi:hypothetical protein